MDYLTFIELQGFSKRRKLLLSDEEYQQLQTYLLENHHLGSFLQHTGGCQKIRWGIVNRGKSGGVRVIYYVKIATGRIYLLLIYAKNEQQNLTAEQSATIKRLIEQLG